MKNKQRYIPEGYVKFEPKYIIGAYPENMFECWVSKEQPIAIFYIGRKSKASWHIRFRDNESMKNRVLQDISKLMSWEDMKEKRKVERKKEKEEIQVGDIFNSSWGYEQTNVEFYQVIEKVGQTLTLQEIKKELKQESGYSSMAGMVRAVKNAFIGEPFKTRSLKIKDFIYLSKTTPEQWHYCSWYA